MLINILAAAGGDAPQSKFGFTEAMQQGGVIAWFILSVLVIMSVGSFYILITKLIEQNKIMSQYRSIRGGAFWKAASLQDGASKLDKNSAWRQLVDDGLAAEIQHTKMTDSLEGHDWMHGSLAGSAQIDKVAGPVGEALIMTAIGLLVAVPAVLAYNWLQSRNRRIAELLSGFSTDVLANITSRGAVKPATATASAAAPPPAAATTAPKV